MKHHSNIDVRSDGRHLTAQLEESRINVKLSDREFWQKYGQLWNKVDNLPLNLTPLLWQGQLLSFSEQDIREIKQYQVLHRLEMREKYPGLPLNFGDRCLRAGAVQAFALKRAGQRYGHDSEEAIRLTAHCFKVEPHSLRSLLSVRRALRNH